MESSFARAYVDLSAIRRNFRSLGAPQKLMPVIKSDAYGHGIVPVAEALASAGAAFMATATVDEGLTLRRAGVRQKILSLLGCKSAEETARAGRENIVPLVYNKRSLDMAAEGAARLSSPLEVAVKFNTGMARLGFAPEEAGEIAELLRARPALKPVLAMSHMAASDCPEEDAFTSGQARDLLAAFKNLKNVFPELKSSLPASAGILRGYGASFDFSRPGIALYGGNPLEGTEHEHLGGHLETAMQVAAPVLQIRAVRAGQSVGYGRAFRAGRDMMVAVLPIGYADGYPRSFSGRGVIAVGRGRAALLGRVCMGMVMIDLSSVPDAQSVKEGDPAFILGGAGQVERPVGISELASAWGTIPYEVFCLLGRNEKEYEHPAAAKK